MRGQPFGRRTLQRFGLSSMSLRCLILITNAKLRRSLLFTLAENYRQTSKIYVPVSSPANVVRSIIVTAFSSQAIFWFLLKSEPLKQSSAVLFMCFSVSFILHSFIFMRSIQLFGNSARKNALDVNGPSNEHWLKIGNGKV